MRFFNSVSELETALDACPPLQSLLAHGPVYVRSLEDPKAWILEAPVTIIKNQTQTRKLLLQFASNVQLANPTSDGLADCVLTLHVANKHVFELIVRRFSRRYRYKNARGSTRPEWQHNPFPFAPERRRMSRMFRRHQRSNVAVFNLNSLPAQPAPQQPEKTAPHTAVKPDNITPFPGT